MEAARQATNLPAAIEARYRAGRGLEAVAERLRDFPAVIWTGVGIKAQAIVACLRIGGTAQWRARLQDSPGLAADAARIAAETVEA